MTDFWLPADPFRNTSPAGGGVAEAGDIFGAMIEQMRLVENSNSASTALNDGYEEWRRRFKDGTGQEPPANPLIARFDQEDERARAMGWLNASDETRIVERQQREFRQFIQEQASRYPAEAVRDWAQFDPAHYAVEITREADETAARLMESRPGWDKFAYAFGGAAIGSLRDPVQIGSLALGGGPGAARTVMGRILATAVSEAAVNAGVEAALQPSVQSWRAQAGLDAGWDQALSNIGFAAVLGAGFGAAGRGVVEGVSHLAAPAQIRGVIQAGDALGLLQAQRPADIAPNRHETLLSASETAMRGQAPTPIALDELQVSRLVESLAPEHADGVGVNHGAAYASTLEAIRAGDGAEARVPRPVMQFVASIGGVDPDGPMAAELRALGITSRDMPGLFKRDGHSDLDNVPVGEAQAAFAGRTDIDDGNGYVGRQSFIDAIEAEKERSSASGASMAEERAHWERQGVDFDRMDDQQILDRMAEISDAESRWQAAGAEARLSADGLVREALELAGGNAPDRVIRAALDLHRMEGEDLATAVEWALSDASGVSRHLPPSPVISRGWAAGRPTLLRKPIWISTGLGNWTLCGTTTRI